MSQVSIIGSRSFLFYELYLFLYIFFYMKLFSTMFTDENILMYWASRKSMNIWIAASKRLLTHSVHLSDIWSGIEDVINSGSNIKERVDKIIKNKEKLYCSIQFCLIKFYQITVRNTF